MKVGDQKLYAHTGPTLSYGGNRFYDMLRSSVRKIVAGNHGDHAEVQFQLGHRLGNSGGFVRIGRAGWGFVYRAEGAAPGATRSKQQEGRCPAAEAFHLIGAARLDADGMESSSLHSRTHCRVEAGRGQPSPEPFRFHIRFIHEISPILHKN
jgi:hypothetical protein